MSVRKYVPFAATIAVLGIAIGILQAVYGWSDAVVNWVAVAALVAACLIGWATGAFDKPPRSRHR